MTEHSAKVKKNNRNRYLVSILNDDETVFLSKFCYPLKAAESFWYELSECEIPSLSFYRVLITDTETKNIIKDCVVSKEVKFTVVEPTKEEKEENDKIERSTK